MITQELIAFIKAQMQEGKSREQIAGMLTPHGWALEDINSAFAQVMPTMPAAPAAPTMPIVSPVTQEPEMVIAQPQIIQPQIVATQSVSSTGISPVETANPSWADRLRSPSALMGTIMMVIIGAISSFALYTAQLANPISFVKGIAPVTLLAGIVVLVATGLVVSGLIVQVIANIVGIDDRPIGRAYAFSGTALMVATVANVMSLLGASHMVALIPGLLLWPLLFGWYYRAGIGKTAAAFLMHVVAIAAIAMLAFFSVNALNPQLLNKVLGRSISPALPTEVALQQLQVPTVSVPELTPEVQVVPAETGTASGMISENILESEKVLENPNISHVKDAFPVGYPLPDDQDIITAEVLSATTFEGVRYILDYATTGTPASARAAIRKSLETDGYLVSVNETNPDYRVMTASKVTKNLAKTIKVTIEKTATGTMVRTVFAQ